MILKMKTRNLICLAEGLLLMAIIGCSTGNKRNPENLVVGNWQALSGNFEQISFTIDDSARFNAYLHQRLVVSGTWKLSENKLLMNYENQETEEFDIRFNGDTLYLNNGDEIYVRFNETQNSGIDETSYSSDILDEINLNMGMRFTEIKPADENWLPTNFEWSKISCPFVFDTVDVGAIYETIDQVAGILSLEGYEPDPQQSTEVISTYKNNGQLVLLHTTSAPDNKTGDTVMVNVFCNVAPAP
jgi:hypothetical protein